MSAKRNPAAVFNFALLTVDLRRRQRRDRLSLRQMGDKCGTSASTLCRLMADDAAEHTPDLATICAIIQWLGTSFADYAVEAP